MENHPGTKAAVLLTGGEALYFLSIPWYTESLVALCLSSVEGYMTATMYHYKTKVSSCVRKFKYFILPEVKSSNGSTVGALKSLPLVPK